MLLALVIEYSIHTYKLCFTVLYYYIIVLLHCIIFQGERDMSGGLVNSKITGCHVGLIIIIFITRMGKGLGNYNRVTCSVHINIINQIATHHKVGASM